MALIVEDGTGRDNAESYVDVAYFDAFCDGMGYDISAFDTATKERKLRKGCQYVDTNWQYKAQVLQNMQALAFPRVGLSDSDGRTYDGIIPKCLKDAQCEATFLALSGEELYQNLDRGGQVVSETVGPISVTYAASAPGGKLYQVVERLLCPLVRERGRLQRPLPVMTGDLDQTEPLFGVGMNDNPEGDGCADL